MESAFGRFWKVEDTTVTFYPVNADEPRLGGKVAASVKGFDVSTFSPYTKTYYGVYGEDFVTYGQFQGNQNPIDNDELLLKIFEDKDSSVVDKHSFKFNDNKITYSRQVDGTSVDTEIEHGIQESELTPLVAQSWSETLFYGVGNKAM